MNIGGSLGNLVENLLGDGKNNNSEAEKAEKAENAENQSNENSGWMMDRGAGDTDAAQTSPLESLGKLSPEVREAMREALEEAEITGMTDDMGDKIGGIAEDVSDAMKDIRSGLSDITENLNGVFQSLNIREAAETLREDLPLMRDDLASKAEDGTITPEEADLAEVVNTPMPPVLLKSLQDGGVNEIDVSNMPMGTPTERVQSVLEAGARAHTEAGLPSPHAEMQAAYETHAHEAVHTQQYEPENDYSQTHEEDHSVGL